MNKKSKEEQDLEDFRKDLEQFDESDFDGHTDFHKLSAREKLEWLSELMYFTHVASKRKKKD